MVGIIDESRRRSAPELSWGRHFLMCAPDYFNVSYSINFWMDPAVKVDRDRAFQQWGGLVDTLRVAGAVVEEIPPQQGLPDMVFTANAGIVDGTTCWPARMRHPQRQPEIAHLRQWLSDNSWDMADPPAAAQEGAGDALPFAGTLVAGYGLRSAPEAYQDLVARTGWTITALELADPRYYHIDLALCPLDEMTALIVPDAFTQQGCGTLAQLIPDPVLATPEEGMMFCANSIVVGRTILMPGCTPRLGRLLECRGFEVVVCDVSEFLKGGGGCRCLTLALDVSLTGATTEIDEVAA
jgi:arginine dihydrolase